MAHNHQPTLRVLLSPSSPAITSDPPVPVDSDVAIILACLICALICVVGLMAVARCTWLHHHHLRFQFRVTTAPSAAVKMAVVESLPRLVFNSGGVKVEATECVICLGEFMDGEEIKVLPKCSHIFHAECVDRWLLESHSSCCPSCRQVLSGKKGVTVIQTPSRLQADYLP